MSDSEDFGGFGGTTPNVPRTAHTNSKPSSSRAQAGPSRNTAGAKTARKVPMRNPEHSEAEEVPQPALKKNKAGRSRKQQDEIQEVEEQEAGDKDENDEEDNDEIEEIEAPPPKARGGSKKPTSRSGGATTAVNGDSRSNGVAPAAAKGKGKAKAKPTTKASSSKAPQDVESMDVDAFDEEIEIEDVEESVVLAVRNAGKARTTGGGLNNWKAPHRPRTNETPEIARLEEQLSQARGHIEDLKRQLDELYQVRHTEPEQLLERMEAQYQVQTQVHDSMVNDLTAKIAQHDPHFRKGKTNVFELLTRAEADKETHALQEELKKYKQLVSEKDRRLKAKDEEVETLQKDQRDLKIELQAEIERGKSLVDKAQRQALGSVTRNPNGGGIIPSHQDPKNTQVIRFYEDLSNVIIPSMKNVPGRYCNTDEWILNCCYTHTDVTDKSSTPKSLYFTLRLCWDLKADATVPIVSMDQLVESVHYLPKELDKESPEFVASLGFLKDNFTFERDQLSLFVRTLHDYVSGEGDAAKQGAGESDSEDSVMLVE